MARTRLTGWGNTAPGFGDLVTPRSVSELQETFQSHGVIARGLGRSYGDPAQLSGGLVVSNLGFDAVGPIAADGVVTVGAGVSIDTLIRWAMPQGWFVPVTPGTRQVTIGGAIAADVHGKNHHAVGSFAHHVLAMRIVTPTGTFDTSPTERADLFWATCGGMGLTGIVSEATIRLIPISSNRVLVDTTKHANLAETMAAMVDGDDNYQYSVAWIDCMTTGKHMGRGILTRGDHLVATDGRLDPPSATSLAIPVTPPSGLLNPLTIRLFNEAWFKKAPRREIAREHSIGSFFHPLDALANWNRLYGPKGFVQYQFAVPDDRGDIVEKAVSRLSSAGVPSFLAVLKRFGAGSSGHLSFPIAGWTLALDMPVGPRELPGILDELDELVVTAGGRIYLAKDARCRPETVGLMYSRLSEFLDVKDVYDPERRITSDLARRLHIERN